MSSLSVSEARAVLPELLDRVLAGEEITITRHGHPVAVMVRPDSLRSRRADRALAEADRVADLLAQGRATPLAEAPTLPAKRAAALVADVAASRSAR